MEDGESVKPETDEEKLCFQFIKDLDYISGHVKGSTTSKKYMRNEIWSDNNNFNDEIESDEENISSKLQPFLKDHPLYKTHQV